MKKKKYLISGVTLVEILIAIVIASIMMMALFTSYNVINNSYSQVSDRAGINRTNRNVLSMMLKDIRMAGYSDVDAQRFADSSIQPILITKDDSDCDSITIVYGDRVLVSGAMEFPLYQITYECKNSKIPDMKKAKDQQGNRDALDLFAVYKSKRKCSEGSSNWLDPATDSDQATYPASLVVDYVEDLILNPIDDKGNIITPTPSVTVNSDMLEKIKAIDIGLILRSTEEFYRNNKARTAFSLNETDRNKVVNDKFLRDTIVVTAYARNIGTD